MKTLCYLPFLLIVTLIPHTIFAGDVESFNSRLFDLLYFTRPFERTAVTGGTWEGTEGTAASVMHNPAALANLQKPEFMSYWTLNYIEGKTYGLKRVIPPGQGNPRVQRVYEEPVARLSDIGVCQTFRPGFMPGVMGIGIDYLWNDLSGNNVSHVNEYGLRAGISYGMDLSDKVSIGYGLTYLYDTWQWTVTWANFTPGNPVPKNTDYTLNSKGNSWRHRIGIQAAPYKSLRFGIDGEFGHGKTDNKWNGVDNGGGNTMRHYGVRAGMEYDMAPDLTATADVEWHNTLIEFGYHSAAIGNSGAVAKWDSDVSRYMLGMRYRIRDSWKLLGGYRYSSFKTDDLCNNNADNSYSTYSFGVMYGIKKDMHLLWNLENSTTKPEGEFMNILSFRAAF